MGYRVVHDYYRAEHFRFFRDYPSPFWAVTLELEITRLREWVRDRELRTYPNLCYFLTGAAQGLEDFRYRLRGDDIVLHDTLHPGLTVSAPGGRFSFAHLDWDRDPAAFNARAAERLREVESGVHLSQVPDRAWLFFSALPKVPFTGLTHAVRGPEDDQPRISFGAFREEGGRSFVPVGLQVNHLFVDGAAVGELVERARAAYAAPESAGSPA